MLDIHFLNTAPNPLPQFIRLGTDIKTFSQARSQGWLIYAKNNAALQFKLKSGQSPAALTIISEYLPGNSDSLQETPILDHSTLLVKTGNYYLIYLKTPEGGNQTLPQSIPQVCSTVLIRDKNIVSKRTFNLPSEVQNIKVILNTGKASVASANAPSADQADWLISITCPDTDINYKWIQPGTELEVSFPSASTEERQCSISMIPQTVNLLPITSIIQYTDSQKQTVIADQAEWIIPCKGTLDFDQDGKITLKDAIYFYNYVQSECSINSGSGKSASLMEFLPNTGDTGSEKILENIQDNISHLNFDNHPAAAIPSSEDSWYLYNFIQAKCPENDPTFTIKRLQQHISAPSDSLTEEAMRNIIKIHQRTQK